LGLTEGTLLSGFHYILNRLSIKHLGRSISSSSRQVHKHSGASCGFDSVAEITNVHLVRELGLRQGWNRRKKSHKNSLEKPPAGQKFGARGRKKWTSKKIPALRTLPMSKRLRAEGRGGGSGREGAIQQKEKAVIWEKKKHL